jgi:Xaa-Pro aminopeptidase
MKNFEIRREKLFTMMKENSIAIIFSGVEKVASEDSTYPFEVNRSFFYLTNIKQSNSVLVLIKEIGEKKTYLFVDEYNELKEKWIGKRLTYEQASELSEITSVYPRTNLDSFLETVFSKENSLYGDISDVYLDLTPELKIDDSTSTHEYMQTLSSQYQGINVIDIKPMITQLRMVKNYYEIERIKNAISLTNLGLNTLILKIKPGMYEYELADIFEFYGRTHSRDGLAFPTIAAAGKNATCLHYPTQDSVVRNDDLVLFDLGYQHDGYCADISRTYPVSGTYKGVQKSIYEAVLNCNKAVIEFIKPGKTIKDLQDFTINFLTNECVRLKLMKPGDDIRKYYYHNVSHHLGLDTHDASNRELPLQPGNIITVEPGLYFAEHNCGVRIEDDVLVTKDGSENLSIDIPKEISDIEKLFSKVRG